MLTGQKILVAGATGNVGLPTALGLAKSNEVWALARFSDPAARAQLDDAGVQTVSVDLVDGDLTAVPDDFTYVLHLAWLRADLPHLERALQANVEGPGLLLQHCRRAKAALVMSGMG